MNTRRFISAGWPYLYDVPALHNCVPMLFADVIARFSRLRGDHVLFLCGGDEHGARVEYVAEGVGRTPREVVDAAHAATMPLLSALSLSFDEFGRTSDPEHGRFVTDFVARLRARDALVTRELDVAWCDRCARVLPDRFVEGTCPGCGGRAYGNQCQDKLMCGKLLRPGELASPRCGVCGDPAGSRRLAHLTLSLRRFASLDGLCSSQPFADEVGAIARRVLDENDEIAITRDFSWGVPIELPDGRHAAVDGWVDSLLAKLSFAVRRGEEQMFTDPAAERLFFLGRDGVPYYSVVLPALLAAADRGYSLARWHVQPNQVFTDEGGVCSRSTGTGVWLAEALATLPGEYWRFYVLYAYAARAEAKDVSFRWERFAETTNGVLVSPVEDAVDRIAGALLAGVPADWRDDAGARELVGAATATARAARHLLGERRLGRAFLALLDEWPRLAAAAAISPASAAGAREAARLLLPLLGCYLPETAARAWTRLALRGSPKDVLTFVEGSHVDAGAPAPRGESIFPDGPIRARDAQRAYQHRVETRRRARTLEEELVAARADKLCGCPSEPGEM
ncbi:MAG: hypothetical protein EXR73_01445 [Myxococcales bacterium]|nr:hypothetical protein [Myxococcales bacterium]